MGKTKVLERRRRSVRNIRKITRTMELISTARFKRAMDRAAAGSAFADRLTALLGHLAASGTEVTHPLLQQRSEKRQAVLLVLTSNRGLCGGYNSAVMRLAVLQRKKLEEEYAKLSVEVSGKRGVSAFKFRRLPVDEKYFHFDARPAFADVEVLARRFMEDFLDGRIDRVDVAYTKLESVSRQYPVVETLLPYQAPAEDENGGLHHAEYEFLPSPGSILEEIVPFTFKIRLFRCFLESAAAEQIARMIAMKTATENADSMLAGLSMAYNRARQTQITSEILEIVSGAEALQAE
ncbi:ATP synthase F1 subunit gamma [Thermopirellula anaerolimosa]